MDAWICDCLNVMMDCMSCLGEDEVLYEDEVEKSSMLFQWNDSIVVLLNMMRRSGINECRCDSSCVPAFHEWRMNMVGECS